MAEENYGYLWRAELHIDIDYHRAFVCIGVLFQQLLTFNELQVHIDLGATQIVATPPWLG